MEVYNAVRKYGVEAADSVLVLGAGPIGLIACQVARIFGARLDGARAIGMADAYLLSDESGEGSVTGNERAAGYDIVIDCAGTAQSGRYLSCGRAAGFFSMASTNILSTALT
jgi:threonine dehydrogenase-like Zn-dependent dehydrogenase